MRRLGRFSSRALAIASLVVLVAGLMPAHIARADNGNANLHLNKTVGAVAVIPGLGLTLAVDKPDAVPGTVLTDTALVTNTGATLTLAGDLTATNTNATTATIASYWDAISTTDKAHCGAGGTNDGKDTAQWPAFVGTAASAAGYTPVSAAPITSGLTLVATPVAVAGVTYPAGTAPDQILGTLLAPGAVATWHYTASIPLTAAQLAFLHDPTQVSRIRNSFHAEPTPRVQAGNGQPDQINVDFCGAFNAADTTGAARDVSVTVTLSDGTTKTIDKSTVPSLASIAPGASATVTATYTVPVPVAKGATETDAAYLARLATLDGKTLTASATATVGTSGPTAGPAGPVSTTEHLPILSLAKTGPATVDAGKSATYDIALANTGSTSAAGLTLTDALPGGAALVVTGAPASLAPAATASAHATYAVPAAQPAGDLTDTATLRWTDAAGNSYGPISASATTRVKQPYRLTTLTLSPPQSGPLPVGATLTLTVGALDQNGAAMANLPVHLSIVGPNATSGDLTTDADGTATFSYQGAHAGTDTAQATATDASGSFASNTAVAIWSTPAAAITTSQIHGVFYPVDQNSTTFLATPASTPAFSQDFPTVNFDPPSGAVPNDHSGVGYMTRPFTDVTTDLAGNYSGTIVAQGSGAQAGVGSLYGFDAVFTGTYTVSAAGNQTFNYFSDDGWMLGIGGGATRVSGPSLGAPASDRTPFESYPLMASYNIPSSPAPNTVTVYFPAPGVYPYEIDYFEIRGGQLCLTVTTAATGHSVPPTGSIALSPLAPAPAQRGMAQTYTAAVTDLGGNPVAGLAVSINVSGANTTDLSATTDAHGIATFTYTSGIAGTDNLEAFALYGGTPIISNTVAQTWTSAPPVPMIGRVAPAEGTVITAPMPVTASISAPAGAAISDWSVSYKSVAPGSPTVILASGSGTPPATLATFDPTVLANGPYAILIAADASGGSRQVLDIGVVVDGNLKLGRYQVTYQDANVPVGGIPMQVLRTYDSFDKSKGAFGVGWALGVSNFRVSVNGALGAGGWSQYESSCVIGICQMAWATARPHFVSVVWPDGHTEIFDFTPTGGSNLFWLGTAAFTARAGSTSKLEVVGDASLSYRGDGNLYGGIGGPLFNPARFRLTAKDGSIYLLDTTSGLVSETDRTGNSVTVDAAGVHSSLGPSVTFTRDGSGRITKLTKPDGTSIGYAYNAAGDLASVTDERGNTVTYQYDTLHNLTKTIDPNGHPLRTLTYGTDGRLKTITDGAGNTSTISLDPNAHTETVTGPDPRLTTVTSMNGRGDIVQIDELFGGKTLTTKFNNDELGHVLSKTDPLGHVTRATYDAAGSPLTMTEPDGGRWTFTYDDHEALTSVTDRTGRQIATLHYDNWGELIKKTTTTGETTYTYGTTGLLNSTTNALGRTSGYGYDSAGHVTSVTGPAGRIWGYTYDADGHTKTIANPASETTTLAYDAAGSLISYTDALGHGQTYTYDALGRVATVTDALGHATTSTYDAGGRLASTLDRNGQTVGFAYDTSGNVTGITLPGGSALDFTYDPLGRLTDANDADATLHLVYDDGSNLASQTSGGTVASGQPTVTLSFGRDATGRPTSVAAPWGTTTYAYGGNGLLSKVTDAAGGVFNLGYDPLGRLASLARPSGVSDAYVYDAAGQFSSRTSTKAGAAIDALSYSYDSSGRRTSKTDSAGTMTYGYDTADRLISVLAPAGSTLPNETFSYDAAGNQTGAGQHYDAANRLLSDSRYDYAYDNEGNQTTKTERATGKVTTYTWNPLHQLTSAHLSDGTTVTYRYDALGRRAEQSGSAGTTRYANLGANVVAEYDGANALRASYVTTLGSSNLPGTPLEVSVGATTRYPLLDGVGSVTALTDSSGAVGSAFAYTAYGMPVGASSGTYAYGTYGYDSATGLYYARARYYDPAAGRFLSEDPVGNANLYPYANGNPISMSDPTGEMALAEQGQLEFRSVEESRLLVQDTAQDFAGNGAEWLIQNEALTPLERQYVLENPWAVRRACGTVIHRLVAESLKAAGFVYKTKGPDFLIMIGGQEVWIELTTPGSVAQHVGRGGLYLVAEMATYILLL